MSDILAQAVLTKYDADKSGTLSRDDLPAYHAILVKNRPDLAGDYDAWFDSIDQDHDGTISKEELAAYFTSISYDNPEL